MTQNYEPYSDDELDQMSEMPEVECRILLKQILFKLDAAGWTGRRPTTLEEFRGVIPLEGWGRSEEWSWYFRIRSDHSRLYVGIGDRLYAEDESVRLFAHEFNSPDAPSDTFVRLWQQLAPPDGAIP